jgi:hypothetical protein
MKMLCQDVQKLYSRILELHNDVGLKNFVKNREKKPREIHVALRIPKYEGLFYNDQSFDLHYSGKGFYVGHESGSYGASTDIIIKDDKIYSTDYFGFEHPKETLVELVEFFPKLTVHAIHKRFVSFLSDVAGNANDSFNLGRIPEHIKKLEEIHSIYKKLFNR